MTQRASKEICCPVCGSSVDGTKIYAKFDAITLPVYQCLQCPKAVGGQTITFVLMPDGAMIHPGDVCAYLQHRDRR